MAAAPAMRRHRIKDQDAVVLFGMVFVSMSIHVLLKLGMLFAVQLALTRQGVLYFGKGHAFDYAMYLRLLGRAVMRMCCCDVINGVIQEHAARL